MQAHIKTKSRQNGILDESLTFRQRVNKLGQEMASNGGAVELLKAGAGLLI